MGLGDTRGRSIHAVPGICVLAGVLFGSSASVARQPDEAPLGTRTIHLTFEGLKDQPAPEATVRLLPAREAQAQLAMLSIGRYGFRAVVRRVGTTDEQGARARELALANVGLLNEEMKFPEGTDEAAKTRMWERRSRTCAMIMGILAAEGAVGAIVERPALGGTLTLQDATARCVALAHADNLAGRLEAGETLARLGRTGEAERVWRCAAANALEQHGFAAPMATVREGLFGEPYPPSEAGWTLARQTGPEALALAREYLDRALALAPGKGYRLQSGWGTPPVVALLYLLAYGDESDLRKIEGMPLGVDSARTVSELAADPGPLAAVVLSRGWQLDLVMDLLERAHRLEDEGAFDAIMDLALDQRAAATAKAGKTFDRNASSNTLHLYCTQFRPDPRSARLFVERKFDPDEKQNIPVISEMPWMTDPGFGPQYLARMGKGQYWATEAFRCLPAAAIEKAVASPEAKDAFEQPELAALYFRHYLPLYQKAERLGATVNGTLTRAFGVRRWEDGNIYAGAISGTVNVRPRLIDNALRLEVWFEIVPAYFGGSLVDFKEGKAENYDHHRFVADAGRELLKAVHLRHGGKAVKAELLGREGGKFLFAAPLTSSTLAGLFVQVDIQFFDQEFSYAFDVACSGVGRRHRHDLATAEAARAAYTQAPSSATAARLGDALGGAGRASEAARIMLAQAVASKDSALAVRAVDVLTGADLHAGAAEAWKSVTAAGLAPQGAEYDRGAALFAAGAYADAATVFGALAKADAKDVDARYFAGVGAYLAGDDAGAAKWLVEFDWPPEYPVALALQYALTGKGERADALAKSMREAVAARKDDVRLQHTVGACFGTESLLNDVKATSNGVERCRVACFRGLAAERVGKAAQAAEHFTLAAEVGDRRQIERLIAARRLQAVPPPAVEKPTKPNP